MLSSRPLRIDDVFEVTVELPGGVPLTGQARVLRQDLPKTYGLRFEALEPDAAATLARVVDAPAFSAPP